MSNSIDDLFKRPTFVGTKRKFEPVRNPDEIYKAAKLSANGTSRDSTGAEDAAEDDEIAGPAPPSEDEEQDDEEGRFFGGGVSKDTADVLDFIDEQDTADVEQEKIDSAWLRRLAFNFEKRISKNAELRAKYEEDPTKFMASEADLDADIKALSILSEHPELYAEFAKLGCVSSLVSLLAHENTDIAIDAIEIIVEMTDEDVQAQQSQWDVLVEALLEAELPSLLIQNLDRLDEANETDRTGVYHTLSLIENLASQPSLITRLTSDTTLLTWLVNRILVKEPTHTQNKSYAAEILAILLQSSEPSTLQLIDKDAVDLILQLLAAYRKRDPEKDSDEEEFVENLFNALTCCISLTPGKQKFLDAEGAELCLIMLREGKFSKPRALRLLDHALGGLSMPTLAEKVIEVGGLKTIFGMWMKQKLDLAGTEHVLGIFASLLALLPGESAERIRLLAKFVEGKWEKVEKLLKVRQDCGKRLAPVNAQIATERKATLAEDRADMEAEWQSRRLDAGLYSFQTSNVVLAWLIAEDTGAKQKIVAKLGEADEGIQDVEEVLRDLLGAVKDATDDEGKAATEMYQTLIEVLRGDGIGWAVHRREGDEK